MSGALFTTGRAISQGAQAPRRCDASREGCGRLAQTCANGAVELMHLHMHQIRVARLAFVSHLFFGRFYLSHAALEVTAFYPGGV